MTKENFVRTVTNGRMVRMPKLFKEGDMGSLDVIDENTVTIKKAEVTPKVSE